MGIEVTLESMTLANVAEGALEERFQEELLRIAQALANSSAYRTSGGRVSADITLAVHLSVDPQEGDVRVAISGEAKLPKRKAVSRGGVSFRDGKFRVYNEHKQQPLPLLRQLDKDGAQ